MADFDLNATLPLLPTSAGCYLMKDKRGQIVYIGKARNLRARIRSYFGATTDIRFFVGLLSGVLGSIDTIVCSNDKEAILLENELIKLHQPKFNVKLKDDSSFLHIRIDRTSPYPRLEVVRRPAPAKRAVTFGPYHSASAIRNTLRILNRHFYLRTCPDAVFRNRSRPCLEYQIHRCPGPCVLPYPQEEYATHIDDVILFLSGRTRELVKTIEKKMTVASEKLDYERAAHYRDQIAAIEQSLTRQNVALDKRLDLDVVGLYREGALVSVQLHRIRSGVLTASRPFPLGRHELPDSEIVTGFVQLYYDANRDVPAEVLLPVAVESAQALGEWLTDMRGGKVRVHTPKRGIKRNLVSLAERNAEQSFHVAQRTEEQAIETLSKLQQRLRLRRFPGRIECFDISNIAGKEAVASMVCFLDGEPAKAEYRKYRIRSAQTPDDFRMMFEVITRRFKRVVASGESPDLVVIDGGKGQLNAARQAMSDLGIVGVDIVSLAKARVSNAGGQRSSAPQHSPERVFVAGVRNAIVLKQTSSELYVLTRVRDEAHRFAIEYHRKLRRKRTLSSALDSIEGVGPRRKKELLRHFGSVKRIREAPVAEIASTAGIGPALAARIGESLKVSE